MSAESEHIEGAFVEGYWAVHIRLRDDGADRRFLCHARNDREVRGVAGRLALASLGARGFAYYRLKPSGSFVDDAPGLGEYREIASAGVWAGLMASAVGYENLNSRAR